MGAFIAGMFLSKLVLSDNDYTQETLPCDYPGGWCGFIQTETDSMKTPYLILAAILVVIAVIIAFCQLPRIKEGNHNEGEKVEGEKLIDFNVLKRSHLRWGVICQFFYNGSIVCFWYIAASMWASQKVQPPPSLEYICLHSCWADGLAPC